MHTLALQLISCLAIGLGKRPDYFESWFKEECSSVFRAIHYNPRNNDVDANKLVTPEHADSGFITLLSTFMYPGLEVMINGKYRPIKPVKDAIIVNMGETLERISNHRIKATMHRVADIGQERYSCPFFFDPKFSARQDVLLMGAQV
jgi:isopenicillin N synthase-like dioxygenase